MVIILDGNRFKEGIEKKHLHENDEEAWNKARRAHLQLARRYDIPIINANQPEEIVAEQIFSHIVLALLW